MWELRVITSSKCTHNIDDAAGGPYESLKCYMLDTQLQLQVDDDAAMPAGKSRLAGTKSMFLSHTHRVTAVYQDMDRAPPKTPEYIVRSTGCAVTLHDM